MNLQPLQNSAIYSSHAVERTSPVRAPDAAEKSAPLARQAVPDYDEYVPEDKAGFEHSGFYEPVQGENGPELRFDAPEDSSPSAPEKPSGKAEQTTTNTDRVDREIEKLRSEREELSRQLRSASPDEAEKLQKRLEQLKNELRTKDNDSYRRAHAVIS